jgi:hypothetical protein
MIDGVVYKVLKYSMVTDLRRMFPFHKKDDEICIHLSVWQYNQEPVPARQFKFYIKIN